MPLSAPATSPTLLIVESEALVRMELADRLAEIGFTPLTAADADAAIRLMETHPEITLLMTDITMAGSLDGVRLAHFVRHRWPPVKIIVASGLGGTPRGDLPVGAEFLAKPYWPEALAEALARLTDTVSKPAPRRLAKV